MGFSKQPKTCQDAAVGFQRVNALNDNAISLKDELELQHVTVAPAGGDTGSAGGGSTWRPPGSGSTLDAGEQAPGRHDLSQVPRGTAVVERYTALNPFLGAYTDARVKAASGCVSYMRVVDIGVYFFPISGYVRLWGKATPHAWTDVRTPCDARVYPAQVTGPNTGGLYVCTFQLQNNGTGNEMLAFHTGFYLVVFGCKSAPAAAAPAMAKRHRPSRFAPGPMHWWPSRRR